jgi:hypothetical protein
MGGYGSGRRYGSKSTTGDYLQLDVRRLQRDGFLERRFAFNWQWTRSGEPVGNINIRPEEDRVVLSYRHRRPGQEWESKEYSVPLERRCCHYGGERVWFRCPALGCGRRVAILYGGAVYACRHCHQLAYQSQRESFSDRAARRVEAIRARLGGWGTIFDPTPWRPKGMHHTTYQRLAQEYETARYNSVIEFAGRMGMLPEDALELA